MRLTLLTLLFVSAASFAADASSSDDELIKRYENGDKTVEDFSATLRVFRKRSQCAKSADCGLKILKTFEKNEKTDAVTQDENARAKLINQAWEAATFDALEAALLALEINN